MSVMNQKPSEAGWFYHAPAKKTTQTEPVGAPPASQIPGLGEVGVLPPEQPREMVFKDTDSKYIRLAKMGGRKDLLVIRPNSGTQREPKGYPRSEWFYLEDNAQQDRAQQSTSREPWKFLLPEYMVHQSMGETTLPEDQQTSPRKGVPMRPAPFALDQQNMRATHGHRKATTRRSPRAKGQGEEAHMAKTSSRPAEKEDPTDMAKILAYSYQREWHEKHRAAEEKQARNRRKSPPVNKSPEPSKTDAKPPPATTRTTGREQNPDANNNQVLTSRQSEKERKEPFKLSKFKKIPSRLDTQRSTEILKAKGK